ncbi:MAG: hypothetical protein ABIH27_01725 [Candidatus Omnitrophota bacterium]
MFRKILSLVLTFGLLFQQVSFAQVALELNLASYLSKIGPNMAQDKFRPIHLRYFSYDSLNDSFKLLVDKGDELNKDNEGKGKENQEETLKDKTQALLNYFLIGVTLPDSMFWVNLRPDSEDQIIDQYLEKTDMGKIMLETDLQLKKDTSLFTSPNTPEGREYWTKLYKKAEELYGYESVTIPTLTRPWIVPGEIIVRESQDSAYIYKATLKVMLEQDYLKESTFSREAGSRLMTDSLAGKDERSKALNEYSSGLIRELIIPKLTKEVNSSKRYASFRQVYYSLILSRWFKARFRSPSSQFTANSLQNSSYINLIDTKDLTNLISQESWSKTDYFKQYQKSFSEGEYNVKEPVYTPTGQVIRSYFSGGIQMGNQAGSSINNPNSFTSSPISTKIINSGIFLQGSFKKGLNIVQELLTPQKNNSVKSREEFLEVYEKNDRDINKTRKELDVSYSMAEHYRRIYVLSNSASADLKDNLDKSSANSASPVIREIKKTINLLDGTTQERVLKAYKKHKGDLTKTAFETGLNFDIIEEFINDANRKKGNKVSSPVTDLDIQTFIKGNFFKNIDPAMFNPEAVKKALGYFIMYDTNEDAIRSRINRDFWTNVGPGNYINLKNVFLAGKNIDLNRYGDGARFSTPIEIKRDDKVGSPDVILSDEDILGKIKAGEFNSVEYIGRENPLNIQVEFTAQRLAQLMLLAKDRQKKVRFVFYSDHPNVPILKRFIQNSGYEIEANDQQPKDKNVFTILVDFKMPYERINKFQDTIKNSGPPYLNGLYLEEVLWQICQAEFDLLKSEFDVAMMQLPDVTFNSGMINATRIFMRARALYDTASSSPVQDKTIEELVKNNNLDKLHELLEEATVTSGTLMPIPETSGILGPGSINLDSSDTYYNGAVGFDLIFDKMAEVARELSRKDILDLVIERLKKINAELEEREIRKRKDLVFKVDNSESGLTARIKEAVLDRIAQLETQASLVLQADVKFAKWYGLSNVEEKIPPKLKEAILKESVPVIQESIRKSEYFESSRTNAFEFPALSKIGDFYLLIQVPPNSKFAEGVKGVLYHQVGSYLADVEIKFKPQALDSKVASSAVTYVDINEIRPLDNSSTWKPENAKRFFINRRVKLYTLELAMYEPGMKTYLIFKIDNKPDYYAYLGNNFTIDQHDVVRALINRIKNGSQLWTDIDLIQALKKELSMSQNKPEVQELPALITIEPIRDNKIKAESGGSGAASSPLNQWEDQLAGIGLNFFFMWSLAGLFGLNSLPDSTTSKKFSIETEIGKIKFTSLEIIQNLSSNVYQIYLHSKAGSIKIVVKDNYLKEKVGIKITTYFINPDDLLDDMAVEKIMSTLEAIKSDSYVSESTASSAVENPELVKSFLFTYDELRDSLEALQRLINEDIDDSGLNIHHERLISYRSSWQIHMKYDPFNFRKTSVTLVDPQRKDRSYIVYNGIEALSYDRAKIEGNFISVLKGEIKLRDNLSRPKASSAVQADYILLEEALKVLQDPELLSQAIRDQVIENLQTRRIFYPSGWKIAMQYTGDAVITRIKLIDPRGLIVMNITQDANFLKASNSHVVSLLLDKIRGKLAKSKNVSSSELQASSSEGASSAVVKVDDPFAVERWRSQIDKSDRNRDMRGSPLDRYRGARKNTENISEAARIAGISLKDALFFEDKFNIATSSPMQESKAPDAPGGIDLRALPTIIQPMGSFKGLNFSLPQLSQEELRQFNVASEIELIKNMVKAGNIPSGDRIKELIAACVQKGQINSQIDNLLLCLVDTFKLEEENALESSAELREALVIVDSIS